MGGRGLANRFNERAAIAEFDGGLSRAAAETIAFNDCVSEELYLNPVKSDAADGCVSCGADDRANDPLLAIGLGGGEVWLHRECSPAWHAGRIAEAVAALAAMGITGSRTARHEAEGRALRL